MESESIHLRIRDLTKKIEENQARYLGRMNVQRSASTRVSVKRYLTSPNSGLIVRPNGDLRLDCMAPFVIGNVLKSDFKTIWDEKGHNCWKHPKVQEYISKFNELDFNEMITNYVDSDIYL